MERPNEEDFQLKLAGDLKDQLDRIPWWRFMKRDLIAEKQRNAYRNFLVAASKARGGLIIIRGS